MTEEITKTESEQVQERLAKLKADNDAFEAELLRAQKLRAQAILGGRSEMTKPVVEETPQEKWKREAKVRYAGTGYDPT